MTPKHRQAMDIISAVSELSPYKNTNANLHVQWVMGYLAGSLVDAMLYDSKIRSDFVKQLKKPRRK